MPKLYEPDIGQDIEEAVHNMLKLANGENVTVIAAFNDVPLLIKPGGDAQWCVNSYRKAMDEAGEASRRKRESWLQTTEGQAHALLERERAARAQALRTGPLPAFTVKDAAKWTEVCAKNTDAYGHAIIRYAAYWAHLMEAQMSDGDRAVAQVADLCGNAADVEGITGFMHSAALAVLRLVWARGEELWTWAKKAE